MKEQEFLTRIQDLGGLPSTKKAARRAMTVLLALIHLLYDSSPGENL